MSLTIPHTEKSVGVISGERDDHGMGATLPIHLPGNSVSRQVSYIDSNEVEPRPAEILFEAAVLQVV